MNIKADVFTALSIAIAFEGADLVEGDPQIGAAEGFILVELQPVLIVEVEGPKLAESHGEVDFISGIEPGENRVRRFDEAADTPWIARELRDGQRMANGRKISMIHRLIRLRLDGQANAFIMGEHLVERF